VSIGNILHSKLYHGINLDHLVSAGLTGLTHLDLFGALIVDSGMNCFRCKYAYSKDYPIQEDYHVSSKKNAAASLGAYYLDVGALSYLCQWISFHL